MQYGNEIYLAIAGVGQRIILIALRPVFGIGFSFSTITSFNYGAERLRRVKKVLREAILWLVGDIGFEPMTSAMSTQHSNQLS